MKAGLTKWRIIGITGILFFALIAFLSTKKVPKETVKETTEDVPLKVLGDLKPRDPDAQKALGKMLTFSYRGKAARVEVIATEPGMYPAKSIESDNEGRVPLRFFDNFKSEFEFLVRQTDDNETRGAFWGPWKSTVSETFRLKSASDLVVKFTNAENQNITGASLRLGRDSVSLLWLEAVTDENGEAEFLTLPPGRYVISGTHTGHTSEMAFVHHSNTKQIILSNDPMFSLKGIVKNEDGKPIPDAIVECYISGQDYASDIVSTDLFGQFSTELKGTAGEVIVRHSRFITKYVSFEDQADKLQITLQKGNEVAVSVKDNSDKKIIGALVSWVEKDAPNRIGEAKTSDETGEITFKGVPEGAVFTAFFGGYKSAENEVHDGEVELILSTQNDLERRIRFRVTRPNGVEIAAIHATQSNSKCKVNPTSDRDFEIVGCAEGSFELKVQTNHGHRNMVVELRDGSEIELGATKQVRIRFKGIANEKWGKTTIQLDQKKVQIDLINGDLAEWKGEFYPARYDVLITNSRIGEVLYTFDSTAENDFVFTLRGPTTKQFWVVDAQQSPVTNAYMMLWKGDTLMDVASSSGQLPTEFRHVDFSEFRLIVIDPQRGEGGGKVDDLPERIVISEPIGTLQIPQVRVDKEKIKHELGVTFSEKDRGFLIDVEPESLAEQIGLEDGDFWISAYFDVSKRIQLIVARKGKFKVTSFDTVLEPK